MKRLAGAAVLGGGPGGLYGRATAQAGPARSAVVDVYEQDAPQTTFGFGVGLAAGTQQNLRTADPGSSRMSILDHSHPHEMSLRVGDETRACPTTA